MTKEQIEIITNLYKKVTMLPGTWDKSFVRKLYSTDWTKEKVLTDKQEEWIYRLLYKYRRQIPHIYEKHKTNPFCAKRPAGNYPKMEPAAESPAPIIKEPDHSQLNLDIT